MISWSTLYDLLKLQRAIEEGRINVKEFWKSKTIWANFITILTIIGTMMTGEVTTQAGIPALITAVVNLGLRFVTNTGIGSPANPPAP